MYDLGVVVEMVDEIVVMYVGWIVERVNVDMIFVVFEHFYMWGLLFLILCLDLLCGEELVLIFGCLLLLINLFGGCSFYLCCLYVCEVYKKVDFMFDVVLGV